MHVNGKIEKQPEIAALFHDRTIYYALNLFFISYNLIILRDIHDLTRLIRNLNNVFIHYGICVEVLMY
jgi:hypothetical protein